MGKNCNGFSKKLLLTIVIAQQDTKFIYAEKNMKLKLVNILT